MRKPAAKEHEERPVINQGPIMVRLINTANKPEPRDITLRDGTNVRLAAYHPQRKDHISEPILKKLIPLHDRDGKPSAVGKMIKRGEIKMEEV